MNCCDMDKLSTLHCSKNEAMIILRLLKKRETEITEFTMEYHEIGHLIENVEEFIQKIGKI